MAAKDSAKGNLKMWECENIWWSVREEGASDLNNESYRA